MALNVNSFTFRVEMGFTIIFTLREEVNFCLTVSFNSYILMQTDSDIIMWHFHMTEITLILKKNRTQSNPSQIMKLFFTVTKLWSFLCSNQIAVPSSTGFTIERYLAL